MSLRIGIADDPDKISMKLARQRRNRRVILRLAETVKAVSVICFATCWASLTVAAMGLLRLAISYPQAGENEEYLRYNCIHSHAVQLGRASITLSQPGWFGPCKTGRKKDSIHVKPYTIVIAFNDTAGTAELGSPNDVDTFGFDCLSQRTIWKIECRYALLFCALPSRVLQTFRKVLRGGAAELGHPRKRSARGHGRKDVANLTA
jgi:hypothetical protein